MLSKFVVSALRSAYRAWPVKGGSEFPGRVGAFAAKQGIVRAEWVEFQPGLWMQLDAGDLIQQTILFEGIWDPLLTQLITSTLKPGGTFVDIGAHVGYCTLIAAQAVGPSGRVLAAEPNPGSVAKVQAHLKKNKFTNVILESTAMGDSTQPVTLFLDSGSNSGLASLSKENVKCDKGFAVPCNRLDDLVVKHGLTAIDLIKVDVEGAELSVLKGMAEVLRRFRPVVVIELEPDLLKSFAVSTDDVVEHLAGFDYTVTPLGGHANYVCHPSEKVTAHIQPRA